ncbi:MAG: hypothetical protein Q8L48_28820 [Archangium sp.]|nr:hypothetical protein [Archangium sp.]
MLQLLVAACLAIGDGGAGEDLAADPYGSTGDTVAVDAGEAPDAGVPVDAPIATPLPDPLPPAPPPGEAERRDGSKPEFVKGELSMYLGSDRLAVKNTRIGVAAGLDRFLDSYYALIEPMVDLRLFDAKLGIGIGVPLRIEIVNLAQLEGKPFANAGRLRVEDYDTFHDFGRILKYITYGRKEDQIYVSAGQRYASSIGHGAITRRYSPSINPDYPRASAQVDMYNDYGGFELMTNDLLEWNQLSGLAFFKPLSFFKPQNLMAKTFSIGVTGGLDWAAPFTISADQYKSRLGVDGRPLVTSMKPAALIGFDAEMKVVKTDTVDIKPYVDYSLLFGGDGGFTAGVLGRFNVAASREVVHAFRLVVEARFLGSRYAPSYFDTFYEVDRFAYLNKDYRTDQTVGAGNYVPKQRYLLETGLQQRFGYYVEGSWGVRNVVGLTLALEGTSASPAVNFVAHLEVPVLSFVQVFGSYYLRGVESWTELGTPNFPGRQGVIGLFGDKSIAFAGARLKILPILFLNGRVYKTFRVNADLGRFDNQFGFAVDLEIGYEFRKAEPAPPPKEEPTPAQGSAMGTSAMR